ncbi:hypothetical protein [Nocardioides bizhenqiangii]|uniref:Sulfotransferase family protein n=1 Tax=Nocardioides bizhenqiangii TaxID=3095076 RepID=A0ABZ0ZV12_9ACTN|nr:MULTISPECIES: hypothetical protein [unclassified Nocardioides]MDZ5623108.1 hypothetical protein [Nocardioides sp. HM23]WQQ28083.1 hypothetical protein SHK19_07580 [Nocardioides sp. HM61]
MDDRIDVVLHLGTGKTGTSTIQALMRQSRPVLAEQGVLYPRTPGPARHARFGLSFRSDAELAAMPAWHQMRAESPERFRRRFERRLREEIRAAAPSTVVFSDEALYGLSPDSVSRLRAFTDSLGGQTRLVVYLRRQDEHLSSDYQQHVKTGEVRRLVHWTADHDRSATYAYARRLARWEAAMEPAELVVRRFEPTAFKDGSLEADFLDAAGLSGIEPTPVPRRNESLDAETVEFLRIFNLYLVAHAGGTAGLIDHRELVRRLSEHGTGPVLTLPESDLDLFLARWADSNRETASRYFGDTELFREPRRTTTTDVQLLDPDRVDHYLDVGELPSGIRADLHRIAAQEARSSAGRPS